MLRSDSIFSTYLDTNYNITRNFLKFHPVLSIRGSQYRELFHQTGIKRSLSGSNQNPSFTRPADFAVGLHSQEVKEPIY